LITTENSHIGHCTHTLESTNIKTQKSQSETRDIGTMNSNKRIAATVYSLGTLFVSGISVQIPCIKAIMMMLMLMIIIIIITLFIYTTMIRLMMMIMIIIIIIIIKGNNRIAATMYSLGTLFVSGIYVQIPCIKAIMMMIMIMIIIIIMMMMMMMIIIIIICSELNYLSRCCHQLLKPVGIIRLSVVSRHDRIVE
jgi:hypothetical protein